MASDEGAGGQVEEQTAIHLLVEVEVEVVEAPLWIAKLGLLGPSLQQAISATSEFIRDQTGEEVARGHGFGLSFAETGFQHGLGTAVSELPESYIPLDVSPSSGPRGLSFMQA